VKNPSKHRKLIDITAWKNDGILLLSFKYTSTFIYCSTNDDNKNFYCCYINKIDDKNIMIEVFALLFSVEKLFFYGNVFDGVLEWRSVLIFKAWGLLCFERFSKNLGDFDCDLKDRQPERVYLSSFGDHVHWWKISVHFSKSPEKFSVKNQSVSHPSTIHHDMTRTNTQNRYEKMLPRRLNKRVSEWVDGYGWNVFTKEKISCL